MLDHKYRWNNTIRKSSFLPQCNNWFKLGGLVNAETIGWKIVEEKDNLCSLKVSLQRLFEIGEKMHFYGQMWCSTP